MRCTEKIVCRLDLYDRGVHTRVFLKVIRDEECHLTGSAVYDSFCKDHIAQYFRTLSPLRIYQELQDFYIDPIRAA